MNNVLLLHPGAMGSSIGHALLSKAYNVCWVSTGRSVETRRRAESIGLTECATLDEALEQSDLVVSVCPPEFAFEVGESVYQSGYKGLYCDANAIAPSSAKHLLELFKDRYVDGGIVGPPAHRKGSTRLYLSGVSANAVREMFTETNVDSRTIDGNPLAASAIKMCYAAYTKGTSALLLALRALAESHDVANALKEEWDLSQPGLWERSERTGPGTSGKAWRFAPEMREIAKTLDDSKLPNGFHLAAAEIYERMAKLKHSGPTPTEQVVDILLSRLQE